MRQHWLLSTALAALVLGAPNWGHAQGGAVTGMEQDVEAGAAPEGVQVPAEPLADAEVIALDAWGYDETYAGGWSAEQILDTDVYGPTGEEIGEIENVIVGPDGRILSIIAEVGGFWDIGDTHVNIPWDEVEFGLGAERVVVPVTEENVNRYSDAFERSYLGAETAATDVVPVEEDDLGDDLITGPRAWRVDELIGDYARLEDGMPYGYVRDVIFDADGTVSAVVVSPRAGYGFGTFGYPWYGYRYGWAPASPYYDLPYRAEDVAELDRFEYDRLEGGIADVD